MTNWTDRVVVITGAASGIGAATARAFAGGGARLTLVDLDGEGAKDVAEECRHLGATSAAVAIGDVGNSSFCNRTVDDVVAAHGRIDVLVTAAGTIHRADALGTDDRDWRSVLAVNVDGTFFACRAALRHMRASRSGVVVTFGSIWGDVGAAGVAAYCASKGAVHQLTRALALDHVEEGVRVNAVAPGEVDTPMLASQRERPPTAEELQELADATIPMKRLAEPDEVAAVVVFLASDEASYVTGEIVHVDGGYTAR